jgi:S1-C subfamily serine protease
LQPRDIIRSLNNRPVVTLAGLRELVQAVKPGTPVTLQVQREGRLTYVSFTVE